MTFQIWLPLPNEVDSLKALSDEDLTELRFSILEVVEALHSVPEEDSKLPPDWQPHRLIQADHPILESWEGYVTFLCEYGLQACEAWAERNDAGDPVYAYLAIHMEMSVGEESDMGKPNWWGDVNVHLSHQRALLDLNREHYKQHFLEDDGPRQLLYPVSRYASPN